MMLMIDQVIDLSWGFSSRIVMAPPLGFFLFPVPWPIERFALCNYIFDPLVADKEDAVPALRLFPVFE